MVTLRTKMEVQADTDLFSLRGRILTFNFISGQQADIDTISRQQANTDMPSLGNIFYDW